MSLARFWKYQTLLIGGHCDSVVDVLCRHGIVVGESRPLRRLFPFRLFWHRGLSPRHHDVRPLRYSADFPGSGELHAGTYYRRGHCRQCRLVPPVLFTADRKVASQRVCHPDGSRSAAPLYLADLFLRLRPKLVAPKPVLVIGTGEAGLTALELLNEFGSEYNVVGFIEDDLEKRKQCDRGAPNHRNVRRFAISRPRAPG